MELLDSSNKENRKIFLNNSGRSKSPHAVESLLLLDNTLLCNIEPDSGSYISLETCKPFQEFNSSTQEQVQNVTTGAAVSSRVSPNVSSNEWQDKTLMNEIFAQFDSQNEEEIIPECNNISNLDIFDTFCKEDINSQLGNVNQNIGQASLGQLHKSTSHRDELMNVSCLHITNFDDDTLHGSFKKDDNKDGSPVLKTKPRTLNECKILRKKLCLNDAVSMSKKTESETDSTNCSSFYGLPDTVKKLVQEIKGICELYRKFAIVNQIAIQLRFLLIFFFVQHGKMNA